MKSIRQYIIGIAVLMVMGYPGIPLATAQNRPKPNIVIILADDMGQGDIAAFNPDSKIRTPNLNRLAKQGMRFSDAHSGSAVCTPTRYGLLTGRYAFRSRLKKGVLQGYSPTLIDSGQTTIGTLAKLAGYRTACIGKWHLGLNWQTKDPANPLFTGDPMSPARTNVDYTKPAPGVNQAGFDYSFVLPASLDMPPYCFVKNGRVVNPTMNTIQGHDMQVREIFYRTGAISAGLTMPAFMPEFIREATSFIQRNKSNPFLLYLPLSAPHTPWAIEERFRGSSRIGTYGDFVQQTDYYIGQVLEALETNGISQNTLVIFASDNGSYWTTEDIKTSNHASNNNWRGMKADIYEGGHRIPLLIRWPGIIGANTSSTGTVCLTDLLATVADAAQQPLPAHAGEDSYSLMPLFMPKGTEPFKRTHTIHHSADGAFAIRQGDWKYVSSLGSGGFTQPKHVIPKTGEATGQLYNLRTDPQEQKNLFQMYPDKVSELAGLLAVYEQAGQP